MRKITILAILVLISAFSFAATGWFNDFLTISVNDVSASNNYFLSDSDPASGATALNAKVFGLVSELSIAGADMKYWADGGDVRTGAAFYYKITNVTATFEYVAATEVVMDQVSLGVNNYQGTKTTTINLLAGLPYGTYKLHVWAKSWGDPGGDSYLSNSSNNYVSTFTKIPAATTPLAGTLKVGDALDANYNSLSAAVYGLNTSGLSDHVFLEIVSDIAEPVNISLGINTEYKIRIKPASGLNPIITFTDGTTGASIDGHFVIGSPNALNSNLISTNYITIDGSNTEGGTTKDLTINGPVTTLQRSVFRVYGNNDNIIIKNCIITCKSTSGSTTAPINITNYNTSSTNYTPDNITIVNNTLTGGLANGGSGVTVSNSGTPTTLMTGIKVQNNFISARATRAILFNYVGDGEISGNTITHDCQLSTGAAQTIAVMAGGSAAGTFNIFNNRITQVKTWNTAAGPSASNGAIAIDNQLASPKIVNIYNNFITGFTIASATVKGVKIYGIRHIGGSTSNIFHNTIVIPEMTDMTDVSGSFISAIAFATAATAEAAPAGTMNIKNNIIVSNESTMKVWGIRRVGTNGTFTSDNNVIYAATANNLIGYYNATDAIDLAAWRTASGQDAASKSAAVIFENAATGDLRIAGLSVQDINLKVPSLATVTTDILGTVRNTEFTYAGAHESILPFLSTGIDNGEITQSRILRTMSGVEVQLNREATIELYTINGVMMDKARVNGTYSRDLNSGVYIIRIDGKATKFVK
jgi:hypothetical protein